MSTITAILGPDVDGSLHVPLPPELRHGKVRIEARLELVTPLADAPAKKGTPLEAFQELRKLGGMKDIIPDPEAWQREQRVDRPLPGRDCGHVAR